jgi:hypothetical protein
MRSSTMVDYMSNSNLAPYCLYRAQLPTGLLPAAVGGYNFDILGHRGVLCTSLLLSYLPTLGHMAVSHKL